MSFFITAWGAIVYQQKVGEPQTQALFSPLIWQIELKLLDI